MGFNGTNMNCIGGNSKIPSNYIFNPGTSLVDTLEFTRDLVRHSEPATVRSIIWVAERDPVETQWLHIPLTSDEIDRITTVVAQTLDACKTTHYELAWGPLWEALPSSVAGQLEGDCKPNNPYETLDELASATVSSFTNLCTSLGKHIPTSRIQLDLFNELDARTQPKNILLMQKIYPTLVDICIQNRISYTVSTIIEPDGSTKRARMTYIELGKIEKEYNIPSMPFASIHMNGFQDAMLKKHCRSVVKGLKSFCGVPVGIGECDTDLSFDTELEVMYTRPMYFCNWSK